MFELVTDQAKQWLSVLRDFDGTMSSVSANVAALQKLAPQASSWPAAMRQQQATLLAEGLAAQSKLQALKATRDKVVGWLRAVIPGGSNLGVLPLIYIGVGIAAFVTALEVARRFLTGSASFAKQVTTYQAEQRRLVEQGVEPAEAARLARLATQKLADSADRPGLLEKLGGKAIWVGGGVVLLIWLGPKILDRLSSSRRR